MMSPWTSLYPARVTKVDIMQKKYNTKTIQNYILNWLKMSQIQQPFVPLPVHLESLRPRSFHMKTVHVSWVFNLN